MPLSAQIVGTMLAASRSDAALGPRIGPRLDHGGAMPTTNPPPTKLNHSRLGIGSSSAIRRQVGRGSRARSLGEPSQIICGTSTSFSPLSFSASSPFLPPSSRLDLPKLSCRSPPPKSSNPPALHHIHLMPSRICLEEADNRILSISRSRAKPSKL